MLPARLWTAMTWPEVAEADTSGWIVVLPVAAVEQHGPHLPLGTDLFIMQGYLAMVGELLADDLPVTFLPIQAVGVSPEHTAFAGTLSLSPEAALKAWGDLGDSLARAGVRKLVMVSSHGGNSAVMDILARELRLRHNMLAVTTNFSRFGAPEGLFSAEELAHGMHAGAVETALMLHFRNALVRIDACHNAQPRSVEMERDYRHLRTARPAGFGWLSQDLHESGAMGDATAATAEAGAAMAEHGARAFVELLEDVRRFSLRH